MTIKTVLLIESGKFIGGVIHDLLQRHEHLEVIEALPTSSHELLKMVDQYKPQVVVLDDTVDINYLNQLLRYMQCSDNMRVIVVDTNDNRVSVYQKQQIQVNQTADLFAVL